MEYCNCFSDFLGRFIWCGESKRYECDCGRQFTEQEIYENHASRIQELEQKLQESRAGRTADIEELVQQMRYKDKELEEARAEVKGWKENVGDLEGVCSELRAEVERLNNENHSLASQIVGRESMARLAVEQGDKIEKLRSALEKYGRHSDHCSTYSRPNDITYSQCYCTCGLSEALEQGD